MCPSSKVMTMRTEVKEHLEKYWFRYVITFFGIFFLINGDAGDDPKLLLFIGGGFITFCGLTLINSQRISDLRKRIEDLEKGDEDDE